MSNLIDIGEDVCNTLKNCWGIPDEISEIRPIRSKILHFYSKNPRITFFLDS